MAENYILLSNGNKLPLIGLGTYKLKRGETREVVKYAISVGYRHIDCAMSYGNEAEIGEALKDAFASGLVKREELFITSKLWNTYHRREKVREGCLESMTSLGLDYLDLYLVHWPCAFKEGNDMFPKDKADNMITSDTDYLETWKGMEDCFEEGLVKSIGLSNFNSEQIQRVLDHAIVKPVVLQVESHPHLNQIQLINFCKQRGIAVTAHSLLGSPQRSLIRPDDPVPLENPLIKQIAGKYQKTVGQVLIRYQIQRNVGAIPKSSNKKRMKSNLNVFDFSLSNEDMAVLNSFEQRRLGAYFDLEWIVNHPYYPYKLPF